MTVVFHHHDNESSWSSSLSKGSRGKTITETTRTTITEEANVVTVLDRSHARNRSVSWWIIALAHCGIICGIYSTLSCEWFVWTPMDDARPHGIFAVDSNANQAESVGLFRYRYDNDPLDEPQNERRMVNTVDTTTTICRYYDDDSNQKDWILIARETDPWMFTAQLCWVMATLLAGLSTLGTFFRVCYSFDCWNHLSSTGSGSSRRQLPCCVASGWLLASGLQAASCLAATGICGGFDFWECPWLQGAHASAGAAWFYLLCWLLSMCGYQPVISPTGSLQTVNHHHHYHHHNSTTSSARCHEEEKQEIDAGSKMTAEELLGTADPVIHRAVGQKALSILEFTMAQPRMDTENDDPAIDSEMEDNLETATIHDSEHDHQREAEEPSSMNATPQENDFTGGLEP